MSRCLIVPNPASASRITSNVFQKDTEGKFFVFTSLLEQFGECCQGAFVLMQTYARELKKRFPFELSTSFARVAWLASSDFEQFPRLAKLNTWKSALGRSALHALHQKGHGARSCGAEEAERQPRHVPGVILVWSDRSNPSTGYGVRCFPRWNHIIHFCQGDPRFPSRSLQVACSIHDLCFSWICRSRRLDTKTHAPHRVIPGPRSVVERGSGIRRSTGSHPLTGRGFVGRIVPSQLNASSHSSPI